MLSLERQIYQLDILSKKGDGYSALSINYFISQFAGGMLSLYGLLFVFSLGNGVSSGIQFVFLFYFLQRLITLATTVPIGKIISTIGYRWSMFIGLIFLSIRALMLSFVVPGSFYLLIPAFISGGLSIPFYYLAYHALFLDDNVDAKVGEQMGFVTMLGRLSFVISPVVGGFLTSFYGFSTTFVFSFILILLSVIPLFLMREHRRHKKNFNFKALIGFVKKYKRTNRAVFSWYFTYGIQAFFWPVFVVLIIGNYQTLGILWSSVMVLNSLALFLIGKVYDKKSGKGIFIFSSILVSLSWIGRFFSKGLIDLFLSDSVNRLSSPLWWMKIRRRELVAGETINSLVFGAAHEIIASVGFLLSLLVGYIILRFSGNTWTLLIIPVLIGTILPTISLRNE